MDILWFKLVSLVTIVLAGLLGGLAPLRIGVSSRRSRWLTLGNAFSGGVFMGTGLLHMLLDAQRNFAVLAPGRDYPLALLISGGGFLLVLFFGKVLLAGSRTAGSMFDGRRAYPLVLLLVLSLHSIIAGTSLGLESGLGTSIAIFMAIISHKSAEAFALGTSLKQARFSGSAIVKSIGVFSCMTPLGIVLGGIFTSALEGPTAVGFEAVFDALAAGTFLYIAVLEIIEEVFEERGNRWPSFLLMLAGFGIMALLAIWT